MPASLPDRARRWTADELLALQDDGNQYELVRGELKVMPPAGGPHGAISGWLFATLGSYVQAHELGILFTEATGFKLARDPDTVRAPDIAFLARARIPAHGLRSGFIEGAPDLAIEILSPDDPLSDVETRVREYLLAGARAVWIINPKLRTIAVHRPEMAPYVLTEADTLEGGEVVPGFACEVGKVFTWADWMRR
jgi:Uma2 family endonuclease